MKWAMGVVLAGLGFGLLPHNEALAVAPVCITHNDSAGLAQALSDAANGGGSGIIEVEQGTYVIPPTGWLYQFGPLQDVSLLGGYVQGTNCQQRQITASPNTPTTNTILDGQSQNGAFIALGLKLSNPANFPYGTLTIEGFEIRNLQSSGGGGTALFATFDVGDGFTGGIVFRYNWVHDSIAADTIVELHTGGPMTFTNNLIDKNISATTSYLLSADFNAAPWRIVNNTIANNTGEGLLIDQSGTYVQMFNNILYANTSSDLVADGAFVELHGDTYGTSATTSGGNISNHGYAFAGANPGYDTTTFHLTFGSSSVNSGAGFASVLPDQDLDGNPRWAGSNPDRGAFETNTSDQAYWVVTSTADSSHATDSSVNCNPGSATCTLREAITRANVVGASTIAFHLGGSCGPFYIALSSPLPDVNVPLLVDGFSQPGSAENTGLTSQGGPLNEKLCVVVEGLIADSVASAFVVGATDYGAQLEVRGITFEAFTGPAISVAQGSYHWIHGNTFGVETDNNPFVFSNAAGVAFGAGVTFSTIGGTQAADVNVFGRMNDSTKAVISVASTANGHFGNAVAGNLLGLVPGVAIEANQGTGLLLQGTNYNEVYANTIVASAFDGINLSASNSNWVYANNIGSSPQYGTFYVPTYSNSGTGIAVYSGSAHNHIGAFDQTAYQSGFSNSIENNGGPGVWIENSAGTGNTILSNYIGFNGPSTGGDLAIDYGPLGSAVSGGVATIAMEPSFMLGFSLFELNFLVTGTGGTDYRVDFYLDNGSFCDSSGYGPAEIPLQTNTFTMPGSGFQVTNISQMLPVVGVNQSPSNVAAAVTDMATGVTSQISNCAVLPNDQIFANGFDPAG